MKTTSSSPIQLITGSFLTGMAATYIYTKYTERVSQYGSTTSARSRPTSSLEDPFSAMLRTNDISIDVFNHLTRVYATLGAVTLVAVAGTATQSKLKLNSTLTSLIGLGFAVSLMSKAKMWKLLGAGFFNGMSMGGLVAYALRVDANVVPLALASTAGVFASFAAAATLSSRRSLLYLYGGLGSAMSVMAVSALANLYLKSNAVFNLQLYGGLAVFTGYVMADSQLIIERADQGDRDFVTHAFMLWTDLSAIFTRLLIILMQQKQQEQKRKRRRGRDEDDEQEI